MLSARELSFGPHKYHLKGFSWTATRASTEGTRRVFQGLQQLKESQVNGSQQWGLGVSFRRENLPGWGRIKPCTSPSTESFPALLTSLLSCQRLLARGDEAQSKKEEADPPSLTTCCFLTCIRSWLGHRRWNMYKVLGVWLLYMIGNYTFENHDNFKWLYNFLLREKPKVMSEICYRSWENFPPLNKF